MIYDRKILTEEPFALLVKPNCFTKVEVIYNNSIIATTKSDINISSTDVNTGLDVNNNSIENESFVNNERYIEGQPILNSHYYIAVNYPDFYTEFRNQTGSIIEAYDNSYQVLYVEQIGEIIIRTSYSNENAALPDFVYCQNLNEITVEPDGVGYTKYSTFSIESIEADTLFTTNDAIKSTNLNTGAVGQVTGLRVDYDTAVSITHFIFYYKNITRARLVFLFTVSSSNQITTSNGITWNFSGNNYTAELLDNGVYKLLIPFIRNDIKGWLLTIGETSLLVDLNGQSGTFAIQLVDDIDKASSFVPTSGVTKEVVCSNYEGIESCSSDKPVVDIYSLEECKINRFFCLNPIEGNLNQDCYNDFYNDGDVVVTDNGELASINLTNDDCNNKQVIVSCCNKAVISDVYQVTVNNTCEEANITPIQGEYTNGGYTQLEGLDIELDFDIPENYIISNITLNGNTVEPNVDGNYIISEGGVLDYCLEIDGYTLEVVLDNSDTGLSNYSQVYSEDIIEITTNNFKLYEQQIAIENSTPRLTFTLFNGQRDYRMILVNSVEVYDLSGQWLYDIIPVRIPTIDDYNRTINFYIDLNVITQDIQIVLNTSYCALVQYYNFVFSNSKLGSYSLPLNILPNEYIDKASNSVTVTGSTVHFSTSYLNPNYSLDNTIAQYSLVYDNFQLDTNAAVARGPRVAYENCKAKVFLGTIEDSGYDLQSDSIDSIEVYINDVLTLTNPVLIGYTYGQQTPYPSSGTFFEFELGQLNLFDNDIVRFKVYGTLTNTSNVKETYFMDSIFEIIRI